MKTTTRRPLSLLCLATITLMAWQAAPSSAHVQNAPCHIGTASSPSSLACALYAEGAKDLSNHDPVAAEKAFSASLHADPGFIPAWYGRVVARYGLGNFRGAQVDLLHLVDRVSALHRQYYNTSTALRAALQLPRNKASDDYIGALVGIIIGDERGAFVLLNAVIAMRPRFAEAYHFRANIYDDTGDRQHAEADYRHALALDPRSYGTLYSYGLFLGEKGDYRGEQDYMTRAIEIHPFEEEAWVTRGIARDRLGDIAGAIGDETQALHLNPQSTNAWIDRADFEIDAHQYHRATADATMAIHIGRVPAAYLARAIARRSIGDARGAYSDADEAIRLVPQYEEAYIYRGSASGDLHEWPGALADARTAIRLNSSDPSGYNLAGWALVNLSRPHDAVHYLDHALALDSSFVDALVNRCQARTMVLDYKGAVSDCTRAIDKDSQYGEAYLDRGAARFYMGDKHGAGLDFESALSLFTYSHDAKGIRSAKSWLDRLRLGT